MGSMEHIAGEVRDGYIWKEQDCPIEPKIRGIFDGTNLVPSSGGLLGKVESLGSKAILRLSDLGEMGIFIQTWAQKK